MKKECGSTTTICLKGELEIDVSLDDKYPHVWVRFRHPYLPVGFVMDRTAAATMADAFALASRILSDSLDDANLSPVDREESIDLHKPPV